MEATLRLVASLSIFLVMISWEYFLPRRVTRVTRKQRWPVNLGLAVLNMVIIRVTVAGIAYSSAVDALENGWGVLHLTVLPHWVMVLLTLFALDLLIYGQHRLAHRWMPLWRLHQVHHADLELDATSAVRFHPLEIMVSLLIKVVAIYVLGAEPMAVIAFEILLNGAATFNHSNIRIPIKVDKVLQRVIVTPDMHRIHHSCQQSEMDSNYGFSISLWDRLFKTYTAKSHKPQTEFELGLAAFREPEQVGLLKMLTLPFKTLGKK